MFRSTPLFVSWRIPLWCTERRAGLLLPCRARPTAPSHASGYPGRLDGLPGLAPV
jgi:hypothetical protein